MDNKTTKNLLEKNENAMPKTLMALENNTA